jgi:hypothetical protein
MNEKQAREIAELRSFLTGRGITVELLEEDWGNMHIRVPADQESAFRAAMADWTKSRTALFFKRGSPPAGGG